MQKKIILTFYQDLFHYGKVQQNKQNQQLWALYKEAEKQLFKRQIENDKAVIYGNRTSYL